ncbi:MAG: hypothetical protein AAFQ52_03585 [Chloroflexota bacterium]
MANPEKDAENKNAPNLNAGEEDQSDALKKAILKLQESGMLSHMPDDLAAIAQSMNASDNDEPDQQDADEADKTIPSRPTATFPTVVSTLEDAQPRSDDSRQFSAIVSGWEDNAGLPSTPSETAPNLASRAQDTPDTTESSARQDTMPTEDWDDWSLPTESTEAPTLAPEPTQNRADPNQALTLRRKEITPARDLKQEDALTSSREQTPWVLQQFFDGEIDLEQELSKRFPTIPALTTIKFRTLGTHSGRQVATLNSQDGSASLIIDADVETKTVQLSFTLGSMMTLRYRLTGITASNRERWLDLMRRESGGMAFLWNENRWRDDYVICIARQYSTSIYAFSPNNFESVIRLTPTVLNTLIDWLEEIWNTEIEPDDDETDADTLLTW